MGTGVVAMYKTAFKGRLNQIYIGALTWGVFYLFVFHDSLRWSETVLGGLEVRDTLLVGLVFQAVFFTILCVNLYTVVIGKKNSVFDAVKFIDVLVLTSLFVLVVYVVVRLMGLPFYLGFLRYAFDYIIPGQLNQTNVVLDLAYIVASTVLFIYLSGVVIFIYQMKKVYVSIAFMDYLRIGLTFALYGAVLMYQHHALIETGLIVGDAEAFGIGMVLFMGLNVLYVLFGFLVYLRCRYSIRAVFVAMVLLFLI